MMMVGDLVDQFLEDMKSFVPERYPVRNQEPRVPLDGRLWHLIHERDGGVCWLCGKGVAKGAGEIDHVVPRSSFMPWQVKWADRSWNLRQACVGCNQRKSNFTVMILPRTIGITARCWDCHEDRDLGRPDPEFDPEITELWRAMRDEQPTLTEKAYCGTCGLTSGVPGKEWIL